MRLPRCPEEEYQEYVERAAKYLDALPIREQEKIKKQLDDQIFSAQKKSESQVAQNKSEYGQIQQI